MRDVVIAIKIFAAIGIPYPDAFALDQVHRILKKRWDGGSQNRLAPCHEIILHLLPFPSGILPCHVELYSPTYAFATQGLGGLRCVVLGELLLAGLTP